MVPDQTKYLTVTAAMDFTDSNCSESATGSFSGVLTIGKTSGVRSIDWSAPTYDGASNAIFDDYLDRLMAYAASGNWNAIVEDFLNRARQLYQAGAGHTVTRSGNTWKVVLDATGETEQDVEIDLANGVFRNRIYAGLCASCTCESPEPNEGDLAHGVYFDEKITVSNTRVDWTIDYIYGGNETLGKRTVVASAEFSNTYTWTEVYAHATAAMAYWNLNDDLIYPWRRDGWLSVAPMVVYCEVPSAVLLVIGGIPRSGMVDDYAHPTVGSGTAEDNYTAWQQREWFDENAGAWIFPAGKSQTTATGTLGGPYYNGTVVGLPGPIGANSFSFDHINFECCEGVGSAPESYGASANSAGGDVTAGAVPKTATNWTNWQQASRIPPGNVVMHFDGGCLVQKTIQLDAATKAQDWARPCGNDSALMEEITVRCVSDSSCTATDGDGKCTTANFIVDIGVLSDPGITPGWRMVVANDDNGNDGFYTVTAVDGSTVDELLVTATRDGDLPESYIRDGDWVMGRRRFLSVGDCNTPLNNSNRRGDFAVLTWTMEYRFLERDRVRAMGSPECPAGGGAIRTNEINNSMGRHVATFTATQRDFSTDGGNAKCRVLQATGLPDSTTADELYGYTPGYGGVLFQSVVMNVMAELFWEPPQQSCIAQEEAAGWSEDPLAVCALDNPSTPEYFYPQRPWVEMRLSPAPGVSGWTHESWGGYSKEDSLGRKMYLGFVTISYNEGVSGLPIAPPMLTPVGCFGTIADEQLSGLFSPWIILKNECACISGNGRFGSVYATQTVCCTP